MTTPTPEPVEQIISDTAPADAERDELGRFTSASEPDDDAPDDISDDDLDPRARAALQKARREAANLRSRLHEAEETIGAAAAREMARDRAEVERLAAEHLVDAQDIWRQEPDIQAYYDGEFQQIVGDKVREAAQAIIARSPHLARPNTAPPPSDRPIEGLRPGARAEEKQQPVTWSSALRGR